MTLKWFCKKHKQSLLSWPLTRWGQKAEMLKGGGRRRSFTAPQGVSTGGNYSLSLSSRCHWAKSPRQSLRDASTYLHSWNGHRGVVPNREPYAQADHGPLPLNWNPSSWGLPVLSAVCTWKKGRFLKDLWVPRISGEHLREPGYLTDVPRWTSMYTICIGAVCSSENV